MGVASVVPALAQTQDVPPAADSAARDSVAAAAAKKRLAADTLRPPLARPYTPRSADLPGRATHWDREAIFASGALTLGELIARVPGVTPITTGFVLSPQVAAWYGDPGRLHLFVDGIEYDPLGLRNGGVADLAGFPLWTLEDVLVERAAGELRVHLRTWRVDHLAPATRTDILTGSENLNLYRGFFGRRFRNGMAVQVAGQQLSSVSRGGIDGDGLGGMARLAWANASWNVDATWLRQGVHRNEGVRYILPISAAAVVLRAMPALKGSESVAYLRATWRDPQADGPWAQIIASSQAASMTVRRDTGAARASAVALADTVDSTATRTQYVVAAGITRWGLRLSSTSRLRLANGKTYFTPGARVEYDARRLTVSGFAERGIDSITRTDVVARFAPLSWINLGGSLSRATPRSAALAAAVSARAEFAVKIRDRWIGGGLITRGAALLAPPVEIDTALRAVSEPQATGTIISLHGPLLLGWTLDLDAIQWNAAGAYRPQTQSRAMLGFESSFLGRFPRGNFHLAVSVTNEFRTTTYVPLGISVAGQQTPGFSVFSTLLEIRIASAVVSWQYRNLSGKSYETYPGYLMPRLVNVYGVRWEFWN